MARKVLIVDDDFSFAEFAKMILRNSGFEAAICLEGEMAVEAAKQEKPDLILMDMHMDSAVGIDAIRGLKQCAETRAIPVLICSITTSQEELKEAMAAGAAGYLPKPLKRETLTAGISKVLNP